MSCDGRIRKAVSTPFAPLPSTFSGTFGTYILSDALRRFPRLGHGLGQGESD